MQTKVHGQLMEQKMDVCLIDDVDKGKRIFNKFEEALLRRCEMTKKESLFRR